MMRFTDPNRLPGTPKSWTFSHDGKTHKIPWSSSMTPWNSFYSQITRYAEANKLPTPSMEEVESHICSQLAQGWCTGDQAYRPLARVPSNSGCKACGRRRS